MNAIVDTRFHAANNFEIGSSAWKAFRFDEVFEIRKGYYNKKPPLSNDASEIRFIGATEKRNGITAFVSMENLSRYSRDGTVNGSDPMERKLFPGACVTVTNNGSIAEAFYQDRPFTCSHDVNPLYLKDKNVELTPELGLFLATLIRAEKYRWCYGRKWRPIRMPASTIRLPVGADGQPDWPFLQAFIKTLPFSSQIGAG